MQVAGHVGEREIRPPVNGDLGCIPVRSVTDQRRILDRDLRDFEGRCVLLHESNHTLGFQTIQVIGGGCGGGGGVGVVLVQVLNLVPKAQVVADQHADTWIGLDWKLKVESCRKVAGRSCMHAF